MHLKYKGGKKFEKNKIILEQTKGVNVFVFQRTNNGGKNFLKSRTYKGGKSSVIKVHIYIYAP